MVTLLYIRKQAWVTWSRSSVSSGLQIGTRQSWVQIPPKTWEGPAHLQLQLTMYHITRCQSSINRRITSSTEAQEIRGGHAREKVDLGAEKWSGWPLCGREKKPSAKDEEGDSINQVSNRPEDSLQPQQVRARYAVGKPEAWTSPRPGSQWGSTMSGCWPRPKSPADWSSYRAVVFHEVFPEGTQTT